MNSETCFRTPCYSTICLANQSPSKKSNADLKNYHRVPQIAGMYGTKREEFNAIKIAAVNIAKREYQKEYMEYWNGTKDLTGTGRP